MKLNIFNVCTTTSWEFYILYSIASKGCGGLGCGEDGWGDIHIIVDVNTNDGDHFRAYGSDIDNYLPIQLDGENKI